MVMFIVGVILTAVGYYLLCFMPSVPSLVQKTKSVVESSENLRVIEDKLKDLMMKEKGLVSVEIGGLNTLSITKELPDEEPVIKVSIPYSDGILTVGLEKREFYLQSIGTRVLIFGFVTILTLCFTVLLMLQGVNDQLLSMASYLKEAEPEELEEITMENWPPEVKQVVASIDIFLKRLEKRLNLKVEEARRDRLFVHNAMVELVECLNQAAKGNLSVRAETSADIVGALGEAFNDSVAVIEERIADAQRVLKELERTVEEGGDDIKQMKEDLEKAKRALFYFKTEMAKRIDEELVSETNMEENGTRGES